ALVAVFLCHSRRPPPSTHLPYTTLFRSGTATTSSRERGDPEAGREPLARWRCPRPWSRFRGHDEVVPGRTPPPHCARHLPYASRSEEHTSELQSRENLVCRLLLEKKKNI